MRYNLIIIKFYSTYHHIRSAFGLSDTGFNWNLTMVMRANMNRYAIVEYASAELLSSRLPFVLLDLSIIICANITEQHAVREGKRYAGASKNNLDPDRISLNLRTAFSKPRISGRNYTFMSSRPWK
jgi:hypothetical protein